LILSFDVNFWNMKYFVYKNLCSYEGGNRTAQI